MIRLIPVTEHLPPVEQTHALGKQSAAVFAYDTDWGWVRAVYREDGARYGGKHFWQVSGDGVSGYEYELDTLEHVTHWFEDLPPPDLWE